MTLADAVEMVVRVAHCGSALEDNCRLIRCSNERESPLAHLTRLRRARLRSSAMRELPI